MALIHNKRLSLGLSALGVLGFAVTWSLHLDRPFSQDWDEGVYLCSAALAVDGYPFYTSIFNGQAPAFLEIIAQAFAIFGESVIVGRAVALCFSLLALVAVGWIAWHIACPLACPVAIVVEGLSLYFFSQATSVQAEIMSLSFALIAIALLLSVRPRRAWAWQLSAGFAFALGALCKLIVVPMALPVLWLLVSGKPGRETESPQHRRGLFFDTSVVGLFFFGVGCIACCGVVFSQFDIASMFEQVVTSRFASRSAFGADWVGNQQAMGRLLARDPLLPLLTVPGLGALFWKKPGFGPMLILWILAAWLFLMDHRPFFQHHLVLLLPPMAVTAASNVLWIPVLFARPMTSLVGSLLIAVFFWHLTEITLVRLSQVANKPEIPQAQKEVIRFIEEHSLPSQLVVSDEQMQVFLARRRPPAWLCDTSFNRIKSGYLTDNEAIEASKNAQIIICATGRLAQLRGYTHWVQTNYRRVESIGGSRMQIYIKD